MLTAVYVAIVAGVGALLGYGGGPVLTVAAATAIALLFQPLRHRAEALANRLVYGDRATPYQVLSEFAGAMARTLPLEEQLDRIASLLANGTAADRVEVWIRVGSTTQRAVVWPNDAGASIAPAIGGDITVAGAGPARFPPLVVVEVKALACQLPVELGVPLSRLHVPDIRSEVVRRGIVARVSDPTIWRWLSEDAIRPWTYRSWIFPRDPDFESKAARVLDLYEQRWEGKALRTGEYVISADEKTSIQARCRCHPTPAPAAGRAMRVEHEYDRGGALQYLAAWDVHRAKVFGRCESRNGIEPFDRLVAQVMGTEPYRSARRVFFIVDNGSSHRGAASVRRLEGRYRNLRLVHLPKHSSWLNQVEIYFSVVQRKVLTPNDYTDLGEVERRLASR